MWIYEVQIERELSDRKTKIVEEYLLAGDIGRVVRDAVYNCEECGGEVISVRRLFPISRILMPQVIDEGEGHD